jgi:hypothetical protein
MAFTALRVSAYGPDVAGAVPDSVPVPLLLSVKLAQVGRPEAVSEGIGEPPAVTVKVKGMPAAIVSLFALVKVGGVPTTRVYAWLTPGPTPLFAEIVATG